MKRGIYKGYNYFVDMKVGVIVVDFEERCIGDVRIVFYKRPATNEWFGSLNTPRISRVFLSYQQQNPLKTKVAYLGKELLPGDVLKELCRLYEQDCEDLMFEATEKEYEDFCSRNKEEEHAKDHSINARSSDDVSKSAAEQIIKYRVIEQTEIKSPDKKTKISRKKSKKIKKKVEEILFQLELAELYANERSQLSGAILENVNRLVQELYKLEREV